MTVNDSKKRDVRFWNRWERAGAAKPKPLQVQKTRIGRITMMTVNDARVTPDHFIQRVAKHGYRPAQFHEFLIVFLMHPYLFEGAKGNVDILSYMLKDDGTQIHLFVHARDELPPLPEPNTLQPDSLA